MSLYLEHFGLAEAPFRITPHTDFFFPGANRGPTLEALIYAITQDEGIVKVTGEVGSGKTTLCRMLLEKLPQEVETLYLANPLLSREEILAAIADELAIPTTANTTHSRLRALQEALIERYAAGRRVVLLIDEAHAMPAESLEEIRLLSNLEAKNNKLLQIVLFAQPELDERLTANDLRQLRERITQHFTLSPLQLDDVTRYIEFRLRAAGYRGPNPFTARAVGLISRHSQGLSRRINILADKALLATYSAGGHQVDTHQVNTAVNDARFAPLLRSDKTPPWKSLAIAASMVAILATMLALSLHFAEKRSGAVAAAPPLVSLAPPAPAAAITATSTDSPPSASPAGNTPLLQQHLAALKPWQASSKRSAYFIQLFTTDADKAGEAEKFLDRNLSLLDAEKVRAYHSDRSGRDRIGVIYGQFASRDAAAAAIAQFPPALRAIKPYPRQVERLDQ